MRRSNYKIGKSALLGAFILLLGSVVLRMVCQFRNTESFVSSFEGNAVNALIVQQTDLIITPDSEVPECIVAVSKTIDQGCEIGGRFCEEYVKTLNNNFEEFHVVYHLGSLEQINLPVLQQFAINDDSDRSKRLISLAKQFERKSSDLQNIIKIDFQDFESYVNLIRGESQASLNLDGLDLKKQEAVTQELEELRSFAIEWREVRRAQLQERGGAVFDTCNKRVTSSVKVQLVVNYLDEVCPKQSTLCECAVDANKAMSEYPQDYLLVQERLGSSYLRHQFNTNADKAAVYNIIARDIAEQTNVNHTSNGRLAIQGGNCLFSSQVNFFGRDILLQNYLDTSQPEVWKNLEQIGLSKGDVIDELSVTKSIERITKRRLIWVGTEKVSYDYRGRKADLSSQPMYHIDLFLALIKFTNGPTFDTLHYLVGVPDKDSWILDCYPEPCTDRDKLMEIQKRNDSIALWIDDVVHLLNKDLKKIGIIGHKKAIPFPIAWRYDKANIKQYFSLVNGIVEEEEDSTIFHMPYFCEKSFDRKIADSVKSSLEDDYPNFGVRFVPWKFWEDAGLHCYLLVLEREDH